MGICFLATLNGSFNCDRIKLSKNWKMKMECRIVHALLNDTYVQGWKYYINGILSTSKIFQRYMQYARKSINIIRNVLLFVFVREFCFVVWIYIYIYIQRAHVYCIYIIYLSILFFFWQFVLIMSFPFNKKRFWFCFRNLTGLCSNS